MTESKQRGAGAGAQQGARAGTTWQSQINESGEFERRPTAFHDQVAEGTAYAPEANRYHLYVSHACPWAHRTLIVRRLKGLEHVISVDVVDSFLAEGGWTLEGTEPGATGDRVNGFRRLREAYEATDANYEGSVTVPVLWDKKTRRIVNNESAEIIRTLNSQFQAWAQHPELDLYPSSLRARIDEINDWVYRQINNGVYQAGFARSQPAYERAVSGVFEGLDRAESILGQSRFLLGDQLTEADVRLFTTLLRFDLVYHTHFKCNLRRLADYQNLWGFTRDIYSLDGVAETVNISHIKDHYYRSHRSVNPYGIVPIGPEVDFAQPHDRDRFGR